MSSQREFQFSLRRAFFSPLATGGMVTHPLVVLFLSSSLQISPHRNPNLQIEFLSTLHSTLRENGQSAGAAFFPSFLPSFHPSSFHPSSVLSGSSPHPTGRLPPSSFQLTFGGNNCFHFIPFVRSFVRSFKVLFPFLSTATDGGADSGQEPLGRPSSSSPSSSPSSLWATKSLHSTSFSSKGFLLVESGRGREEGRRRRQSKDLSERGIRFRSRPRKIVPIL